MFYFILLCKSNTLYLAYIQLILNLIITSKMFSGLNDGFPLPPLWGLGATDPLYQGFAPLCSLLVGSIEVLGPRSTLIFNV